MSNSSNLIFGTKTNLALAATPSNGSFLVAYDSATGFLSQKDDQGVISRIGVAPTASGVLETFPADILVSLSPGKSFGKYVNGDVIPSVGKTAVEVIIQSLTEPITPTVTLNSSTTIGFNQTAISNVLTYTYSINSSGATAASRPPPLARWRAGPVATPPAVPPASRRHRAASERRGAASLGLVPALPLPADASNPAPALQAAASRPPHVRRWSAPRSGGS